MDIFIALSIFIFVGILAYVLYTLSDPLFMDKQYPTRKEMKQQNLRDIWQDVKCFFGFHNWRFTKTGYWRSVVGGGEQPELRARCKNCNKTEIHYGDVHHF